MMTGNFKLSQSPAQKQSQIANTLNKYQGESLRVCSNFIFVVLRSSMSLEPYEIYQIQYAMESSAFPDNLKCKLIFCLSHNGNKFEYLVVQNVKLRLQTKCSINQHETNSRNSSRYTSFRRGSYIFISPSVGPPTLTD